MDLFGLSRLFVVLVSSSLLIGCGGGGGGGSAPAQSTNTAPSFSSATSFSFAENETVQFVLSVTDADGDTVTISETSSGDSGLFQLNATTGQVTALTTNGTFNFENPLDSNADNVYVQSFNLSDGTTTVTETVTVTITNVIEPPRYLGATDFTAEENIVGFAISATDDNSSQLQFALAGPDAAAFTINGASLDFVNPPDFESPADADANNVYEVVLSISNSDDTIDVDLTATITNVDEPPVCDSPESFTFDENTSGEIYRFAATDPEGDAFTFQTFEIVAETPIFDNLSLDAATGAVTLNNNVDFEALTDPTGEIRASAGATVCSATFSVNDLPGTVTSGVKLLGSALAVWSAGDPDGDGVEDIWLTTETDGEPSGLLVFGDFLTTGLPAGTLDLQTATADQILPIQISANIPLGGTEQDLVARRVADIDGDTIDELLVGFTTCAGCPDTRPMAYLIWGSTIVANTAETLVLDQLAANEVLPLPFRNQAGASLDFTSGDFDGDGRADLAFGLPTPLEETFVVFGDALAGAKASGAIDLSSAPQNQVLDLNINYLTLPFAGERMAQVDDIDGDTFPELVLTTAQWVNVVYSTTIANGRTAGSLTLGDVFDVQVNATFGVTALNRQAFDLEDDGIPEIAWAPPASELANVAIGATFATVPNVKFVSDSANPVTGIALSGLGDVSGDTLAELALVLRTAVAPDVHELQVISGAALNAVALGFPLDISSALAGETLRIGGIINGDSLTGSVVSIADLDSDSRHELVVSSPSRNEVYIIRGIDIANALAGGLSELDMGGLFNNE